MGWRMKDIRRGFKSGELELGDIIKEKDMFKSFYNLHDHNY